MVGWIKISLGKEVGLVPHHIVLDEDPVGTQPPTAAPTHFRPMSYCCQTVAHVSNCWALVQNNVDLSHNWRWLMAAQ